MQGFKSVFYEIKISGGIWSDLSGHFLIIHRLSTPGVERVGTPGITHQFSEETTLLNSKLTPGVGASFTPGVFDFVAYNL
jgi:hypothetical protein